MERIGIAASKIAKGNIVLYNLYVILISFLFSLFIFIVAGATVVFALIVIAYINSEVAPVGLDEDWRSVLSVCMVSLTVVVTLFNLIAISKNARFTKGKDAGSK